MSEALRYKAIKLKTEAGNIITYAPHGPDFVPAADYDALHAELSALKAGQGEAVPRELLERLCSTTNESGWQTWNVATAFKAAEELRALLAQSQGVKS